MDHLKRHYRDSLTNRIAALEQHAQTLDREEDVVAVAETRGLAHTLKGSGATYGFAAVSKAAAAVEEAPLEGLPEALEHLLTILRQTVEILSSEVGETAHVEDGR